MAFQGIAEQKLGKFLQIVFTAGVMNQISEDHRDWEMIQKSRVADPDGRSRRFLFQKSFGAAAIQYRNPGQSGQAFPAAQQISVEEHEAVYKEIDATVEIEYNLWDRARKSPAKYAEPLAMEFMSKTIAAKRRLAADLYGDGSGVVAEVASAASPSANKVEVTLSSAASALGHVGFLEYGDLLVQAPKNGTAATAPTVTGTFYAWRVVDILRSTSLSAADKVVLEAVDASGAVLPLSASAIAAGEVFYRVGQPELTLAAGATQGLDLTSISDWGTASSVIAGLESLASNDGRVIHGIDMEGSNAATVLDANGAAFDSSILQSGMSKVKLRVGEGKYSWKMLAMAPETQDSLIEARETDRRFQSVEDNKRGIRFWAYQHGNDVLETYTSEFVPKKRVYAMPEAKAGQKKVIEFYGTDFEPVRANGGDEFHLKPASSGHQRVISSYLTAHGLLLCNHPAAILKITNFS